MAHCYTVAIDEANGIASLNLLTIYSGQILILIVTEHNFLGTIGQGGNCDATVLATHIAIFCCYLDSSF